MAKRGTGGGTNGPVNFLQHSNDARGDKGDIGLGLPEFNDFRGAMGGEQGGPVFNDYRCANPGTGDVFLTPTGRKV